jgi:hypothetical protein
MSTADKSATDHAGGAAIVRAELEAGLPELESLDFSVDCELAEGTLQAVAWTYAAKPRRDRLFLGVRLSEPLTLRGVTLIQQSEADGVRLRWYIDWLDALNRAGLNAALRPVPDGPQPNLADLLGLIR